jgi:hypothetical protein
MQLIFFNDTPWHTRSILVYYPSKLWKPTSRRDSKLKAGKFDYTLIYSRLSLIKATNLSRAAEELDIHTDIPHTRNQNDKIQGKGT